MPSKSKKQQRLMGMVHAYQMRGGEASDTIKQIAKSISPEDSKHYAQTKHKDLPEKVAIMLDGDIPGVVKKAVFHCMTKQEQLEVLVEVLKNGEE